MSYEIRDPRASYELPPEGPPQQAGGGAVNLQAQTNPALDSLLGRQNRYLDTLESGTGGAMTKAAQLVRDAREGGKRSLTESGAMRGVGSNPAVAGYEAQTTGLETKALSDVGAAREATLGNAIQGGLGIARAPGEMSLQERQLGLSAAQLQQQQASHQFDQFMALLAAQRNSPANQAVYTGGSSGSGGGGGYRGGTIGGGGSFAS